MDIKGIFKKDYIVGLDIGSSSIKLAQFIKKEDGLHLIKAELTVIASPKGEAISKGTRNDREEQVVSALKDLFKDLFKGIDVKKSKIIASINCPKTAVKIAKAPYMPKAELRDGINLEAKNYFPFPIDDSLLDYEILGDVVEKGVRKYELAVSVSPKATVDKYLSLLGKAGIKPASFVSCPYALQKLAEHLPFEKDKTTCFIDIGEFHTELVIFSACGGKKPTLMFSRKIPVTGRDFTKVMTVALTSDRGKTELSLDEAEKIKREVGIPPEGEPKIINNKISTTQILAMLRTPLEQLVSEIERCFDYYREESGGGTVDSVVLFGGGASLGGLIKFLSGELGIEVKLGDSLEGLKAEPLTLPLEGRGKLDIAIGAALAEGKGINLLPPEIKEGTKRVVKRGTIEAVATAVILISVLLYIGMRIQLGNFEKRISVAKMELAGLQPQLKQAEAYQLADTVLVDEPHWEGIFKELSNLIPDDIHLTNMNMRNNIITMKGVVSVEDGERLISDFILTLEKGIFKNVKLVKSKDLKDQAGNEFELKCWVD